MLSSSEIEKKVKSFSSIKDIIQAMKAYAGVSIRKTEALVTNIRSYEKNILHALNDLAASDPELLAIQEGKGKKVVVAFGSSQGLCGSFNEKMAEALSNADRHGDRLFLIGKMLLSSAEAQDIPYDYHAESVVSVSGIRQALLDTLSKIMDIYRSEDYYSLTFVFTSVSENKAEICAEQILPPTVDQNRASADHFIPPLTYVDTETIFDGLLEEFLYISLYRCFVESLRSENWYRLRSMESASEGIKKRLSEMDSLQKYVNQEEITEEMLEILGSGMFYR